MNRSFDAIKAAYLRINNRSILQKPKSNVHKINENISIPRPETPSSMDQVFEDMFKNYLPELKHQSKKRTFRALPAVRKRNTEESLAMLTASDLESDSSELSSSSTNVPFKRLFILLKPERRRLSIAMTATLLSTLSTLVFPKAVGNIVDLVHSGASMDQVNMYLGGMVLLAGIGSISVATRAAQLTIVSEQIARVLRKGVFHSMVFQNLSFFDSSDTGRLVNRLSTDTQMVSSTLTDNLARFLRASIGSGSCLCFLHAISPELTLQTMIVFPVFLSTAVIYGHYRKRQTQKLLSALANETQISTERLYGIKTVHSFGKELAEIIRYNTAVDKTYEVAKKLGVAEGYFLGGGFFIGQATLIGVLYYGSHLLSNHVISFGELTSFCMYTGYLFVSIGQISVSVGEFFKTQGAAKRVFTIIDAYHLIKPVSIYASKSVSVNKIAETTQSNNISRVKIHSHQQETIEPCELPDHSVWDMVTPITSLEFRNVSFAYANKPNTPIINNFSASFPIGSSIAIIGQSGSGKSTIGALLMGYYKNYTGSILLNGMHITSLDPHLLRKKIAEVMQEPVLFSGSVLNNITYSRDTNFDQYTDRSAVNYVAKLAKADEFISGMPEGYDSQVGEKGRLLSGGMRQRIAIARALYKPDAEILLLDEFTSALDGKNEKEIINNILNPSLTNKKQYPMTKIIFTHNKAVLEAVDTIIVMENGSVKCQGNYKELNTHGELGYINIVGK